MDVDKNQLTLSLHHVGGRNGARGFPPVPNFEKDILNVLYDADPDCLEQIQEHNRQLQSELHVLPYCIGETCGPGTLNINYDPYTSSMLEMNPDAGSYNFHSKDGFDYFLSDALQPMEKLEVDVVDLDSLFQSDSTLVRPDFLSLDTQGSEYGIIKGAKKTLESHVIAMVVEVEFLPMYKGQKLYGEVNSLLSENGFNFVRFLDVGSMKWAPYKAPIGLRGDGIHLDANALYFKRPESIGSDGPEKYLKLQKLAFIALVFSQFEYALRYLQLSKEIEVPNSLAQELEKSSIYQFLREFQNTTASMDVVLPPSFSSVYSYEASKARFQTAAEIATAQVKTKPEVAHVGEESTSEVKRISIRNKLIKPVNLPAGAIRSKFRTLSRRPEFQLIQRAGRLVRANYFTKYSKVEEVLASYGLVGQANVLRKYRSIQSKYSENLLAFKRTL